MLAIRHMYMRRTFCQVSQQLQQELSDRFPNLNTSEEADYTSMFERVADLSDKWRFNDSELNFLINKHKNLFQPTDNCILDSNYDFWSNYGFTHEQFKLLVMRYPMALNQNKERVTTVM